MLRWVPVPHGPLSYQFAAEESILTSGSPYAWVGSTTTGLLKEMPLGAAGEAAAPILGRAINEMVAMAAAESLAAAWARAMCSNAWAL